MLENEKARQRISHCLETKFKHKIWALSNFAFALCDDPTHIMQSRPNFFQQKVCKNRS